MLLASNIRDAFVVVVFLGGLIMTFKESKKKVIRFSKNHIGLIKNLMYCIYTFSTNGKVFFSRSQPRVYSKKYS